MCSFWVPYFLLIIWQNEHAWTWFQHWSSAFQMSLLDSSVWRLILKLSSKTHTCSIILRATDMTVSLWYWHNFSMIRAPQRRNLARMHIKSFKYAWARLWTCKDFGNDEVGSGPVTPKTGVAGKHQLTVILSDFCVDMFYSVSINSINILGSAQQHPSISNLGIKNTPWKHRA